MHIMVITKYLDGEWGRENEEWANDTVGICVLNHKERITGGVMV